MRVSIRAVAAASVCAGVVVLGPASSALAATTTPSFHIPTFSELQIRTVNAMSADQVRRVDLAVDRAEALRPTLFEGRLDPFDDAVDFRAELLREIGG